MRRYPARFIGIPIAITLLIATVIFSAASCTTVNPGAVGVEVCWGKVSPDIHQPDIYFTPRCHITQMSTRTQSYAMAGPGTEGGSSGAVRVLAKDQLSVTLDVTVMFHMDPRRAIDIYRTFGEDYADTIVHPTVRTAVRDAASEFNAVDLVDHRADLQTRMGILVRSKITEILRGRGVSEQAIVVEQIQIRDIDLPQSIDEAIANVQRQRQATAAAQQANLTAQQDAARTLTIAQGESAALLARTNADAEMLRIQSEARAAANRVLAASLTPVVLEYERIEASRAVLQNGNTRVVYIPSGNMPGILLQGQH